jgi:hypothetical protein
MDMVIGKDYSCQGLSEAENIDTFPSADVACRSIVFEHLVLHSK